MWLYNLAQRLNFLEELWNGEPLEIRLQDEEIRLYHDGTTIALITQDSFWINVVKLSPQKKQQITEAVTTGRFDNLEMT